MRTGQRYRLQLWGHAFGRGDGFTLLELLVAISLLGLVLAMVAGGLRFGLTVWEKGSSVEQRTYELRSSQRILRRLIEQLYPASYSTGSGDNVVLLIGQPSELVFTGPPPAQRFLPGTYRIRIAIRQQPDSRMLTVSWRRLEPDRSDFTVGAPDETSVLIEGIADAKFSYYGSIRRDTAAAWHDRWIDQKSAPLLIRLALRYPTGDPRLWPTLIIAPRVPSLR